MIRVHHRESPPQPDAYVWLSFVGSRASLISRGIALVTAAPLRHPISHVDAEDPETGLLWGARFDRVGGQPAGFYGRPASYIAKETTRVVVGVPCTRHQHDLFWYVTRRDKGMPYDWLGILSFESGEDWHLPGTGFCSEAQANHLEESAVIERMYGHSWKCSPMGLLMAVTAVRGRVIRERRGNIGMRHGQRKAA